LVSFSSGVPSLLTTTGGLSHAHPPSRSSACFQLLVVVPAIGYFRFPTLLPELLTCWSVLGADSSGTSPGHPLRISPQILPICRCTSTFTPPLHPNCKALANALRTAHRIKFPGLSPGCFLLVSPPMFAISKHTPVEFPSLLLPEAINFLKLPRADFLG